MSSADDGALLRRARDRVLADDMLISSASMQIARALNLEGNNRTLGSKIVRCALDSSSLDNFKERAEDYGNIRSEVLQEIYHSVRQRYNNSIIQMRDIGAEEDGDGGEFGAFGNIECLPGKNILKGGLVPVDAAKHTFQAPTGSGVKKTSLLGLDKLAAQKRLNAGKSVISANFDEEGPQDVSDFQQFKKVVPSARKFRSNSEDEDVNGKQLASHSSRQKSSADRRDFGVDQRSKYDNRERDKRRRSKSRSRSRSNSRSRNRHRSRSRDRDRDRDRERDRERDKDRDRGRDYDRDRIRDRDRGNSRHDDRASSRRRDNVESDDGIKKQLRDGDEKRPAGLRVVHDSNEWEAPQRLNSVSVSKSILSNESKVKSWVNG